MEEQKHSPLPWEYYGPTPTSPSAIGVSACKGQVNIYSAPLTTETDANARLIERACNSHYELVEAVKALLGDLSDMERVIMDEGDYFCCRHCGRNYSVKNHPRTALECSDDCAGHIARAALAKATGGDK